MPLASLTSSASGHWTCVQGFAQAGQGHAVLHFKDLRTLQLPFRNAEHGEMCIVLALAHRTYEHA